tara:strand:+ start:101 stop:652 length:552 start_codon:yes stop_codon:yes gene_type:complete
MIQESKILGINGLKLFTIKSYSDKRGRFSEVYMNNSKYKELNIKYLQENESVSKYGVFRGMHFQKGKYAQSKLVRVVKGRVLDFVYDLRKSSITFKKLISVELNAGNLLFVPKGLAHGFLSLDDETILNYKCDNYYYPSFDSGFNPFKSNLISNINFEKENIILSDKDKNLPSVDNTYIYKHI